MVRVLGADFSWRLDVQVRMVTVRGQSWSSVLDHELRASAWSPWSPCSCLPCWEHLVGTSSAPRGVWRWTEHSVDFPAADPLACCAYSVDLTTGVSAWWRWSLVQQLCAHGSLWSKVSTVSMSMITWVESPLNPKLWDLPWPVSSLYSKLCLALSEGLDLFSVWRIAGNVQKECVQVHLCRPGFFHSCSDGVSDKGHRVQRKSVTARRREQIPCQQAC